MVSLVKAHFNDGASSDITPINEFPIAVSSSQPAVLVFKETPEQLYGKNISLDFTSELSPDPGVYVYSVPNPDSETGAVEHSSKVQIEYSQK